MKGTIVAINQRLGTLVVEADDGKCVVLSSRSAIEAAVNDTVEGDWQTGPNTEIQNLTTDKPMMLIVQDTNLTRSTAIAQTTVI